MPSNVQKYGLLTIKALLTFAFVTAGGAKILGAEMMVQTFEAVGVGQWFRYVTGIIEIGGAALLWARGREVFGAGLLLGTMIGAVLSHFFILGPSTVPALVLGVLAATVVFTHRDQILAGRIKSFCCALKKGAASNSKKRQGRWHLTSRSLGPCHLCLNSPPFRKGTLAGARNSLGSNHPISLYSSTLSVVVACLLKCPKTWQDRSLYSLHHTNATFALVNDGMDIHVLAKKMGTSIGMIERHYSHLTPRMKKDMFTGKRYELPAEVYAQQKAGQNTTA